MEIILYVSIAIIAVAFFILVVYLIQTLKSSQKTLDSVSRTLIGLENQLRGVTSETTELLKKTNALAEDVQKKSQNLNSVVDAVKDVGTSVQRFNQSIDQISNKVITGVQNQQDKISQVVQWSQVLMELRDRWKQRRNQSAPVSSAPPANQSDEEIQQKRKFDHA